MPRHLTTICSIPQSDFQSLIETYASITPESKYKDNLKGKIIGLMFDRPSTRTRLSFHKAAISLGAHPIDLKKNEMQLITGEDPIDTARILPNYLDALVIRTKSLDDLNIYTAQNNMAVINALTDEEHPTQSIADLLTIKEIFGSLDNIHILFIGEGGNIAISFLYACAMMNNIFVTFLTPKKYSLPTYIIKNAKAYDQNISQRIHEIHDIKKVSTNFDVVYTTRWRSMGEEKKDKNWKNHFKGLQVNQTLLNKVQGSKTAVIMHDLPAERNLEISSELLDTQNETIIRQAAYKTVSAKAALCWCLESKYA